MDCLPNEIHLWFAYNEDIKDAGLLSQYHLLLNEEECMQYKRFHFDRDRHQYLVTRAMVRSVLSLYADNIAPNEWRFIKNRYGKPSINNEALKVPLNFNISIQNQLIVMAVTSGGDLGIDAEYLLRKGQLLDIASSYFSSDEIKNLLELPKEKQLARFFDYWTLKEAYIKACGKGLSIPLDGFSFSFSKGVGISIAFEPERNDHARYWQFWQIHPNDTHKIAIAIKSDTFNKPFTISMKNIVPLFSIHKVSYPINI